LFVAGRSGCGPGDVLDIDVRHECSIREAVQDVDDLVHPGACAGVVRLEIGARKCLVYIAGNRAGLVQAEAGMLEGENFTEGVPRTLCSGGMPSGAKISTGIG
jgi:hypothetical protein